MQENELKEEVVDEKMEEIKETNSDNEVSEASVNEEGKEDPKENIEKLKAELEDWKQSYLRKQADFQNFSKRKEKELDELRKFSSEKIITKFLGSLDNLERAMEASYETKDFDALVKGVEMIVRGIKDIMSSEGVEEIKASGEYDPQYHHAVSVEEDENFKENEIVKVLQKGYIMKGKVIRPTMVTVKK
ncbi:MAG: nucleotide exchange factor GrpE [Fusobacterium sp.]|uniref:nucleotide exchange factor GrpE n=1 Tax=Fusobacterium sp. TaxID=68766 RepID=UPI0026DBFAA1|nr:nucleotide exchange factor GrpE [Fusobacterium sp.]MDO4690029.1 nucleotide exchange factor GrpE [Fusobacterium sp.]